MVSSVPSRIVVPFPTPFVDPTEAHKIEGFDSSIPWRLTRMPDGIALVGLTGGGAADRDRANGFRQQVVLL